MFEKPFNHPVSIGDAITCTEGAFSCEALLLEALIKPAEALGLSETFHCGLAVTVAFEGKRITGKFAHARWGLEIDTQEDAKKLTAVANELLPGVLTDARAWVRRLTDAMLMLKVRELEG